MSALEAITESVGKEKFPVTITTDWNSQQYSSIANEIERVLRNNGVATRQEHWFYLDQSPKTVLFVGSLIKPTMEYMWRFKPPTEVLFYGVNEGQPIIDNMTRRAMLRDNIKLVTPSKLAKRGAEAAGLKVHDVIPHAINMQYTETDPTFEAEIKKVVGDDRHILLCVADNNIRKALQKLVVAYNYVEFVNTKVFLILHTQLREAGEGGTNIPALTDALWTSRMWTTGAYGLYTEPQMNSLYKMASLYICSSASEGFCLPLLESMRMNTPIVGIDCQPQNEIIKNDVTGVLTPTNRMFKQTVHDVMNDWLHDYNPRHLAVAIATLLSDERKLQQMRSNVEADKNRFDSSVVYKRFLDYLP